MKRESDLPSGERQNVFAPPDRATLRLLSKAQQLMAQDRHAEAVRLLGAIFRESSGLLLLPGQRRLASTQPQVGSAAVALADVASWP